MRGEKNTLNVDLGGGKHMYIYTILYWGYMGRMEKKMETTIL